VGLALPLALIGLLGIAIPLWIHRVKKRTLRELALPTIALLERAVARRRRSLSFRDRPLLYARIALTVLFALALARPFLSRIASYATERPIALVVLLDDSMSMQRRDARGDSLFEAARARAERVLSELAPDSEIAIVLSGSEPRTLVARTNDLRIAQRALDQLELIGARGTALGRGLAQGLRELGGSRLSSKEVLVLTDCASHAGADTLESQAAHLRVECFEGKAARGNPYISGMTLSEGRELDDPSVLTVVLGGQNEKVELAVTLDGKRIGEQTAQLENGSAAVEFSLDGRALRRGRVLAARIESENALLADDVRELSLDDVAALSVLLVDGDPAPNQLDDELRFISLALNLDDGAHGAPRITRIDADGLSAIDLHGFDVVVLANVRAPSELEAERLVDHVARGGGLLIAAGENFDAFGYRGRLSALLPALPRSSAPVQPALGVARREGEASELLPSGGAGLETARTTKRLLLEPPQAGSQALLALSDGTPLLVAGTHGRGRVALLATTLDDDWSDLPLTPGFLPLVHGLVRGLAAVDALPHGPHPAGTVLTARLPLGARALYLLTPDGRRIDLDLDKPTLRITDTAVPGVYRTLAALDQRSERELTQLSFTIVPDTRDSDLTLRRPMPQREKVATAGAGRPRGVESWFWFAFGLLILSEGYLRAYLARRASAEAA
jgi:hypothetical protein